MQEEAREHRKKPFVPSSSLSPGPALPDRVAFGLAYVVSPLSLPPVLFGWVAAHFEAPVHDLVWAFVVGVVFFGLIPLGYLIWMVRHHRARSIEVRNRERRTRPFLVSTASAAAGLATILALNITAGPLIAAIMACTIVNTLVMTLVTRRWKISIHAAATASFVTMLLFVALTAWPSHPDASLLRPATVLSLAPLIPLMMWARVRTGAHTWGQVVAGTLYGLFVPYAELTALLQIGLFDSL